MRRFTLPLLAALVPFAAIPAAAAGAGQPHALVKVKQLEQGKGVRSGYELTPALAQLAAALPRMAPADRRAAEAQLARPDDSGSDPAGTHKWSGLEAGNSPKCTAHFCV